MTPLHRAAAENHVEVCAFLLECKANVNAVDRYQETPLKRAVYNGHLDVLTFLLEAGADLNHTDGQNKMVIHHAAEQGYIPCVEAMLELGAAVNAEVTGYLTPLHFAARNGHTGVARVLIAAGALIDAQGGQSNQAAAHMAAEGGHTTTVRALLEEGADVLLEDSQGRRPALCSADRKTRDVFDTFTLRRACCPSACTVSGPGVESVIEACDVVRFAIQPRDVYGQELRDPGGLIEWSVDIQDAAGNVQEAMVEPCPQFYNSLCYWDASRAGEYLVHVRQEHALPEGVNAGAGSSIPIKGSPFKVVVKPSKLDPYCTRADGKGVTRTEAAVTAEFSVYGRDRFNNPSPGHVITVLIDPNNRIPVDLQVVDLGTGEYKVTARDSILFSPPSPGRRVVALPLSPLSPPLSPSCTVLYCPWLPCAPNTLPSTCNDVLWACLGVGCGRAGDVHGAALERLGALARGDRGRETHLQLALYHAHQPRRGPCAQL